MRISSYLIAVLVAGAGACVAPSTTKPSTLHGNQPNTESEWLAASDLATTLAKAAGAVRLAPVIRVQDHGSVSRRHVTLAAGGCYHAGIAWVSEVAIEASVAFDPGTNAVLEGDDHRIQAPGGSLDFCSEHAGGATLTFRALTPEALDRLDYAVVYGSARPTRAARKSSPVRVVAGRAAP